MSEPDYNLKLYCWFSKSISPDGLLVHENVDGNREQLTTTDEALIELFRKYAEDIAQEKSSPVYLAEFTFSGFKEVILPNEERGAVQ